MEEKKIPNYVIKQIIAKELYTRNEAFSKQIIITKSQGKNRTQLKELEDNAMKTVEYAKQIRKGRIPLEQCLHELTLEEKKNVYQQCEEWYDKNKEKPQELDI